MKKYLDKLQRNIRINKNLFVFLIVIIIVGILAGSIFMTIVGSNDKILIAEYLKDFFTNTKNGELNYNNTLFNTLIFTIGFAILMWLLGISVIGFFVVIFMLFIKSFIIGFSISSIIINYKLKGILLSLAYVFPHQIINVLVFMLITAYALIISVKLINSLIAKQPLDFKRIMHKYTIILVFSVITLLLTSLYEVFIMPKLLTMIL